MRTKGLDPHEVLVYMLSLFQWEMVDYAHHKLWGPFASIYKRAKLEEILYEIGVGECKKTQSKIILPHSA